jgi:DNA-binding transcriptional LysR family regulator
MITIDDIRAFLAVEKHKSFVKAAEELFITPPALSRRIKKLEEFVGEALFERTTQMVTITPSGQVFLERAELVVREFETFKAFASSFAKDHIVKIRFACMWSTACAIVPRLIRDYTQMHEKAEFEVRDGDAATVPRLVSERQVDFGIGMRPATSNVDLQFEPLCDDPVMLACPPRHHLFDRSKVSWAELQSPDMRKVDWGVLRSISTGAIADDLQRENISLETGTKILHLSTQLNFLDAHLRAIIMPRLGISLSRAPEIRAIPIIKPELKREIGIISLRTSPASKAACSFVDHVRENFMEHYMKTTERFTG